MARVSGSLNFVRTLMKVEGKIRLRMTRGPVTRSWSATSVRTSSCDLPRPGSSTIVEDSTGMKAAEKAPSAKSFRRLFGMIQTALMASAGPLEPK